MEVHVSSELTFTDMQHKVAHCLLLLHSFFKGVWDRLHRGFNPINSAAATEVDATTSIFYPVKGLVESEDVKVFPGEEESPAFEDDGPLLEEETVVKGTANPKKHSIIHEMKRKQDNYDELKEMKDLIKSAALWLSERDAESDARARGGGGSGCGSSGGGGRGRGIKRT